MRQAVRATSWSEAASAEMAFAVVDQYPAQSIGALLLRHLRDCPGRWESRADGRWVLSDNLVFEKSEFHLGTMRKAEVVHVKLRLLVFIELIHVRPISPN